MLIALEYIKHILGTALWLVTRSNPSWIEILSLGVSYFSELWSSPSHWFPCRKHYSSLRSFWTEYQDILALRIFMFLRAVTLVPSLLLNSQILPRHWSKFSLFKGFYFWPERAAELILVISEVVLKVLKLICCNYQFLLSVKRSMFTEGSPPVCHSCFRHFTHIS